jgi:hypothetical protein
MRPKQFASARECEKIVGATVFPHQRAILTRIPESDVEHCGLPHRFQGTSQLRDPLRGGRFLGDHRTRPFEAVDDR